MFAQRHTFARWYVTRAINGARKKSFFSIMRRLKKKTHLTHIRYCVCVSFSCQFSNYVIFLFLLKARAPTSLGEIIVVLVIIATSGFAKIVNQPYFLEYIIFLLVDRKSWLFYTGIPLQTNRKYVFSEVVRITLSCRRIRTTPLQNNWVILNVFYA